MISFASKEELMIVENLMKSMQTNVDSNTNDIARLMDLLNNLKGSGSTGNSSGTGSSNDILLLRSRMEYVESSIA